MSTFPTPNRATTINRLNQISQIELENTVQANTAIALDDGTPRAFDLKYLYQRIIQLEQRSIEEQFPLGYIYVQLPQQSEPSALYPKANWQNISATYAGQFFRVEGGLAHHFDGGVQAMSLPKPTITTTISQPTATTSMSQLSATTTITQDGQSVVTSIGYNNEKTATVGANNNNKRLTHAWANYGNLTGVKAMTSITQPSLTTTISKPTATTTIATANGYGERNEVAPVNQTIRIWQKIG